MTRPARLMIVANDGALREEMAALLDWTRLGWTLTRSTDGADGLGRLLSESPDLLFADCGCGVALARRAREHMLTTRVALYGNDLTLERAREALRFGVAAYLPRPCEHAEASTTFWELRRAVERDLSRAADSRLPFDFWTTDEAARLLALLRKDLRLSDTPPIDAVRSECAKIGLLLEGAPAEVVFAALSGVTLSLHGCLAHKLDPNDPSLGRDESMRRLAAAPRGDLMRAFTDRVVELCFTMSRKAVSRNEATIHEALAYMDAHLADRLSPAEVAQYVHMSERHFTREFRLVTQTSFSRYIFARRMDRAAALLREGALSMEEIIRQSGYLDGKYFARSFKKHTGYTPNAYKKLYRTANS